ncbi:MAG: TldD/PmbA family protein [Candidatus Bipolaricaulota bacterium]
MEELVQYGLDAAVGAGADYVEVRAERRQSESIQTKNREVDALSRQESSGVGVRVLHRGAWGFAGTGVPTRQAVQDAAAHAVEIAKATAKLRAQPVELAPEAVYHDSYEVSCRRDPLEVPLEEKLELLLGAAERMLAVQGVVMAKGQMQVWRVDKVFASSEGSHIRQQFTTCGAGIEAYAAGEGGFQRRSYPTSFGGDFHNAGYEFIEGLELVDHAERIGEEAVALLSAPPCPSGTFDIILGSSQMALQIHESVGHPTELDRVMGTELSYAGGSFLSLDKRVGYRYGSPLVTIVADATIPGGLGTFGYDDEGVAAQSFEVIRQGEFANYLTSRESAAQVGGGRSGGCCRASGWNRIPLIRMTNINLLPGEGTLEDLISDTPKGIYFDTNRSWSIDDRRVNFQFGTEAAWEIENGRRKRLVKNAMYTGITPQFWGACVGIAGPQEWRLWGLPNCGKGEPSQVMQVGHGTAPAKFAGIDVLGPG